MRSIKITKTKTIIAIVLLMIAVVASMSMWGYRQHKQLSSSIGALQAELKRRDMAVERSSGCGRPYVEFGRGDKTCSISISAIVNTDTVDLANKALKDYTVAINNASAFTAIKALPKSVLDKDNFTFGSGSYRENKSNKLCTARYDYRADDSNTRLSFSCDDTSWFTRTFE